MHKLAFVFLFVALANARTTKNDGLYSSEEQVNHDTKENTAQTLVCLSAPKNTLWVLDFNDELDFKTIRTANKMDLRAYKELMEPAINQYKRLQLKKVNDKKPKEISTTTTGNSTKSNKIDEEKMTKYDVRKAINMMVNKFILGFKDNVNLYLQPDDYSKVSIKLYFKGPYTALGVRYKSQRWHFFISPPSPFPGWFYEAHTNGTRIGKAMYVEIPENVRSEFYGKLLNMITAFISFAL